VPDFLQRLLAYLRVDGAELLRQLAQAAVFVALGWAGIRVLRLATRRIEQRAAPGDPLPTTPAANRGRTLAQLVHSVGATVIVLAATLLALGRFVNLAPLLAGAGIVTLAVSFGAQGLIKDVIAGLAILAEDQFRVGEVIRTGGVEGRVERMTLRTVTLRDGNGPLHFIPNGTVGTVSNLSRDWARAQVDVDVTYRADVDRVIALLRRLLHAFAADPAWKGAIVGQPTVAGVQRLGDTGVELRLWVDVFPERQDDVQRELRRRIKHAFDEEGIEIPIVQRVVQLTGAVPAGLPRA
jgi:moderate conductance mechanosensitive channel